MSNESERPFNHAEESLQEFKARLELERKITKRDLLAALAMHAIGVNADERAPLYTPEQTAAGAVQLADALLAELDRTAK